MPRVGQKNPAPDGQKDPENLPTYMGLLKDWRAMGGAQDYVLAQCHVLTRKLFQEAGNACLTRPQATGLAQQSGALPRYSPPPGRL